MNSDQFQSIKLINKYKVNAIFTTKILLSMKIQKVFEIQS
jgi:hypothetical protein